MSQEIQEMIDRIALLENRVALLEQNHKKPVPEEKDDTEVDDINLAIANKITTCDEAELIQHKVLDVRSVEAKILLCLYISSKYFNNAWLTSGSIERITSELGVKVTQPNASSKLKSMRSNLESGKVRKNGLPTPYRLNRSGQKRFEEILHG